MTVLSSQNFEETFAPGMLVRIGRKQNGSSHYVSHLPDDKRVTTFDGSLERGDQVLILSHCVRVPGWFTVVQCLTSYGIVWATPGGFRTDV